MLLLYYENRVFSGSYALAREYAILVMYKYTFLPVFSICELFLFIKRIQNEKIEYICSAKL